MSNSDPQSTTQKSKHVFAQISYHRGYCVCDYQWWVWDVIWVAIGEKYATQSPFPARAVLCQMF